MDSRRRLSILDPEFFQNNQGNNKQKGESHLQSEHNPNSSDGANYNGEVNEDENSHERENQENEGSSSNDQDSQSPRVRIPHSAGIYKANSLDNSGAIDSQPSENATSPKEDRNGGNAVNWATVPTMIPDCPPGLEYLAQVDQLLVQQHIEILEVLTGYETNNRYSVKNSVGQQIYFATEGKYIVFLVLLNVICYLLRKENKME